jgi:hypothetical protein
VAVRGVERVAISPARRATAQAVLVEVLHHSRMGQLVVTLERQQIVAPASQDLLGNRGLAPL